MWEALVSCFLYSPQLGGQTSNLGMCPDQERNPKPFGAQMTLHPTGPPGQGRIGDVLIFYVIYVLIDGTWLWFKIVKLQNGLDWVVNFPPAPDSS